jgi:hypothetical protein
MSDQSMRFAIVIEGAAPKPTSRVDYVEVAA